MKTHGRSLASSAATSTRSQCVPQAVPCANTFPKPFHVRPHFYAATGIASESSKLSDAQRKFLGTISPDTRTAVSKYVEVNGPEAFEKLVKLAVEETRSKSQEGGVVEDPLHED
ncbi:hypothetical protein M758_UG235000 [Ceratodon purpureus]|nr:hypothetical protein M758_UG235000 [Ceratodon purpureus]